LEHGSQRQHLHHISADIYLPLLDAVYSRCRPSAVGGGRRVRGIKNWEIRSDPTREPWNKGKLVGQKTPLKLKEVWTIRVRLQIPMMEYRCSEQGNLGHG
jgi:hypothetical protein